MLRQRGDGYYWMCPECGYSQERAMVLRPERGDDPVPMLAGFRADGLVASVLGYCRNCNAPNIVTPR